MKAMLRYADNERQASLAGVNLFFSALLGANVGVMNEMPLDDYFKMILLLTGAVSAIFTIAVSDRRPVIITTAVLFAFILAAVGLLPYLRPEAGQQDLRRLVITMAVWLVMLLILRFSPGLPANPQSPAKPSTMKFDGHS